MNQTGKENKDTSNKHTQSSFQHFYSVFHMSALRISSQGPFILTELWWFS